MVVAAAQTQMSRPKPQNVGATMEPYSSTLEELGASAYQDTTRMNNRNMVSDIDQKSHKQMQG